MCEKIEQCLPYFLWDVKVHQAFEMKVAYFPGVQMIQRDADNFKYADKLAYLFIVFSVCFTELSWSYLYSLYINWSCCPFEKLEVDLKKKKKKICFNLTCRSFFPHLLHLSWNAFKGGLNEKHNGMVLSPGTLSPQKN